MELIVAFGMMILIALCSPTPLLMLWMATKFRSEPFFIGLCPVVLFIYLSTSIWAVREAKRLRFREYRLSVIASGLTAAIGCFWQWQICFPHFLGNRYSILRGRAVRRASGEKRAPILFVLILVVSPLLSFIGLAAIPSLVQSRVRAGEATAITCLRNYHTAQTTFSMKEYGKIQGNTGDAAKYCDNFRNLYYGGTETGGAIRLISQGMADAFAAPTRGANTAGEYATEATPYSGYLFFEDPVMAESDGWNGNFALVAYPAESGVWGEHIIWIDSRSTILMTKTNLRKGSPPQLLRPDESPLSPDCKREWQGL